MPISKGLYNNTLTLQSMTFADDGVGGQVETWTSGGSFRARISPLTNEERLHSDRITQICSHHIYCDNMTVSCTDRIIWGSVIFEIKGIVNPSEAYDHLEIQALEIT